MANPETADAPRPPGKGGRPGLYHPKGRRIDDRAKAELRTWLGPGPHDRHRLIEYLHRIQDQCGALHPAHLAALAAELRLALAEVYEVATFYHNFIVLKDGEAAPATVIRVCDSLPCMLAGAEALQEAIAAGTGAGVRVEHAACMGRCHEAPVVRVGDRYVTRATAAAVDAARAGSGSEAKAAIDLARYRVEGGYRLLESCQRGERTVDGVIAALDDAGLRGLGGAGFPAGRKWRMVRGQLCPRLLAVNGDESEPGTFKDRHYLLQDPHRFLEGMLVAAWVIDAAEVYIYLRDEYSDVRQVLEQAVADARNAGIAMPPLQLRRGAGAYICGEESAMLESLEGKRGLPRHKPPYPAEVGLFGRPTLINNVETLWWVRDLIERGAAWFLSHGRRGRKGLRSFSVSGRVRNPGVKLAPAGISARELIDEFCGGMAEGHAFKAYLPGGASGGILPASLADLPLDFGTLEPHGAFIGSAAVIALSESDRIRDVVLNLMRFFRNESCGQCTPCRAGTEKAVALLQRPQWDRPLLTELAACMADASICGLGQAAPNGLVAAFKHFPDEVG